MWYLPFRHEWYTSGEKDTAAVVPRYVWTAINVEVPLNSYVWITQEEPYTLDDMKEIMAYRYDGRCKLICFVLAHLW